MTPASATVTPIPLAPARSQTQARFSFLDFIRGVAALGVCIEHGGSRVFPHFRDLTHNTFSFGKFGVTAFFLTSGFIIPFSLERGNSLRRFWINRFFRLYPLYWFSVFLAVALTTAGVAHATSESFQHHTLRNTLVNLTMFQAYAGVPDAIGLYYTLAMEMAFYIAFSLLFRARWHRASLPIAWSASLMLALVATLVPTLFHRRVPLAGLFYLVCLTLGTAVYRHFVGQAEARAVINLLLFIVLTLPLEVFCNYVMIKKADLDEHYTLGSVLGAWGCGFAVFLGAYYFRARTYPRLLVWLGAVSYSLYLLHPLVQLFIPVGPSPAVTFAAMMVVPVLASAVTYHLIERPGIALGKRFSQRYFETVPISRPYS